MSKQDELLEQAAEGELLLYVALRPFKAKLKAHSWAKAPKQAEWVNNSGEYVPLNPGAAKGLCMFPDAKVAWFEPDGSWEEDHPLHDHVYVLDKPQKVTREQVRFESSEKSKSTERTEAQQRQVKLIEAVREYMQEQYKQDVKVNRMQALRDLKDSGELRRLGFKGDNVLQKCRKLTDPTPVKKLGLPPLPRYPVSHG